MRHGGKRCHRNGSKGPAAQCTATLVRDVRTSKTPGTLRDSKGVRNCESCHLAEQPLINIHGSYIQEAQDAHGSKTSSKMKTIRPLHILLEKPPYFTFAPLRGRWGKALHSTGRPGHAKAQPGLAGGPEVQACSPLRQTAGKTQSNSRKQRPVAVAVKKDPPTSTRSKVQSFRADSTAPP